MPYSEDLAHRLRDVFATRDEVVEKKMFGGLAFMVRGHMCCGIVDDRLMARVGPDRWEEALSRPFAREMDFTGRSLKGFVLVEPDGIRTQEALTDWVALAEAFIDTLPPR